MELFKNRFLSSRKIGISISESQDINRYGLGNMHLEDITVEMARYLLACGAIIAYGGNIKYSKTPNYTAILSDVVKNYRTYYEDRDSVIINYVAYPLYKNITKDYEADLARSIKFEKIDPTDHLEGLSIDINPKDINDKDIHERFINAISLSLMRKRMNEDIDARIILGGKATGYSGTYPGLVEEAYLAIKAKKPVYLIGAYGGCANIIIHALKGNTPEELTEEYQFKNDKRYKPLYDYYNIQANNSGGLLEPICYKDIVECFNNTVIDGLYTEINGLNNGLTEDENNQLFKSVDIPEIIRLILKGLQMKYCP
ncbi:MAG: hypothetical protein HQL03_11205 [Nitrospirae bacterium]|nr:hypothetical protein [Nitrospirota bacterium]MBF0591097.1 hypothetical protein [Nitrospirota bacterium]